MPSRTDTAGHTKAFDYPVMYHGGGGSWNAKDRETATYVSYSNMLVTVSAVSKFILLLFCFPFIFLDYFRWFYEG